MPLTMIQPVKPVATQVHLSSRVRARIGNSSCKFLKNFQHGSSQARRALLCRSTSAQSQMDGDFSKVRVVTFDLDDTLWPTTGVVLGANSALENWLSEHHPTMKSESSAVQAAIKTIRRENEENIPGYRVYYAQLREAAIGRLALEGGYDETDAKAIGSAGYNIWLQARQDIADKLLFSDVVATLEALKAKGLLIGAITNGNGDPGQVKSLAPFFDLYVSSEQPDVVRPKPDSAPFEVAIQRVAAQLKVNEEDVTRGWVHVGDCLSNDVAAAKRAGMRTVYYAPPEDGEYPSWKSLREGKGKGKLSKFAGLTSKPLTEQEVESLRAQEAKDLSYADAEISQLLDLVPVLENWNEYCCVSVL
mmetsp:Transcript_19032/g.41677  ORF Transcript_19032/g.41677 Transcript_19032/m.41677 type:complete len:361 (-) Transcript_19032:803-1885(-)